MTDDQPFSPRTVSGPVGPPAQGNVSERIAEASRPAVTRGAFTTQQNLNSHATNAIPMEIKPYRSSCENVASAIANFKTSVPQPSARHHPQVVPVPELTDDRLLNLRPSTLLVESGKALLQRNNEPIDLDCPTVASQPCSSCLTKPVKPPSSPNAAATPHDDASIGANTGNKEQAQCPSTSKACVPFSRSPAPSISSKPDNGNTEQALQKKFPTTMSENRRDFERSIAERLRKGCRSPPADAPPTKKSRHDICEPTEMLKEQENEIEKCAAVTSHCGLRKDAENVTTGTSPESSAPSCTHTGKMSIHDIINHVRDPAPTVERTCTAAGKHQISLAGSSPSFPPRAAQYLPRAVFYNPQTAPAQTHAAPATQHNDASPYHGNWDMQIPLHPQDVPPSRKLSQELIPYDLHAQYPHLGRALWHNPHSEGPPLKYQRPTLEHPIAASNAHPAPPMGPHPEYSRFIPHPSHMSHGASGSLQVICNSQTGHDPRPALQPTLVPVTTQEQVNPNPVQIAPVPNGPNPTGIKLEQSVCRQAPSPGSIDGHRVYDLEGIIKKGCKVLNGNVFNEQNHRVCAAPRENGIPCRRIISGSKCKWHGRLVPLTSENTTNGNLDENGSFVKVENAQSVEVRASLPESSPNLEVVPPNTERTIKPASKDPAPKKARTRIAADSRTLRWDDEEHFWFLLAHDRYGNKWSMISRVVQTRSTLQVQSHAQKFLERRRKQEKKKTTIHDLVLTSPKMQDMLRRLPEDIKEARLALAYRGSQNPQSSAN